MIQENDVFCRAPAHLARSRGRRQCRHNMVKSLLKPSREIGADTPDTVFRPLRDISPVALKFTMGSSDAAIYLIPGSCGRTEISNSENSKPQGLQPNLITID